MEKGNCKSIFVCLALVASLGLQGCAAVSAVDAVASGTFFLGKVAVKGTVGATKMIYRGGKSVANTVGGGGNRPSQYAVNDQPYTDTNQADTNQYGNEPSCQHSDGSYTPAFKDDAGVYSC